MRAALATQKDITSTEKLLDLIRSTNDTGQDRIPGNDDQPDTGGFKRHVYRSLSSKRSVKVGVDFSNGQMKLVMVRKSSGNRWELMNFRRVPYEEHVLRDNTTFLSFLEPILRDFCGSYRTADLWVLLSSSQVEIRHIRIPKVVKDQVSNAVYWTCRKEIQFNEKESILDYEVLGEVLEESIPKISVMVYTAPLREVKRINSIFSKAGFHIKGISIPSFAVQNLIRMGWIKKDKAPVGVIHLDEDWSRVNIFSSGQLIMSGPIKTGLKSLTDSIHESMREPMTKSSLELIRAEGGTWEAKQGGTSLTDAQARRIMFSLHPDSKPLAKDEPGYGLPTDKILDMILPPLEKLVMRIERRIEHHTMSLEEGIKRLYLVGETYIHMELDKYITEQIGITCNKIDPMVPDISFLGGISAPSSATERASMTLALGAALSTDYMTPNLLFIYKDKEATEKTRRLNRVILTVFCCLLALFIGFSIWQGRSIEGRRARLMRLQTSLMKYDPLVNQDVILEMTSRVREEMISSKGYARRYMGLAVMGELARITPKEISLYNVQARLDQDGEKKDETNERSIILKGVVFGEEQMLYASLAKYLLNLDNSPLFIKTNVVRSEPTRFRGRAVLIFNVKLDLA
jgi:type IV pilus assembly protein PilM